MMMIEAIIISYVVGRFLMCYMIWGIRMMTTGQLG